MGEKRLKELGYDVKIETDANKGLAIYDEFNPDLVIVDFNMPRISGFDVIKQIRTSKNPETLIMILSGNTQDAIITEAFELGVTDYMKKTAELKRDLCSCKTINWYAKCGEK